MKGIPYFAGGHRKKRFSTNPQRKRRLFKTRGGGLYLKTTGGAGEKRALVGEPPGTMTLDLMPDQTQLAAHPPKKSLLNRSANQEVHQDRFHIVSKNQWRSECKQKKDRSPGKRGKSGIGVRRAARQYAGRGTIIGEIVKA